LASNTKKNPASGGGDPRFSASRAPAVSRAATILRLLAAEREGLGVTEIARRVGLVPSTCLHVLRALVDEGFTYFDSERKTYQTGGGLLKLVQDAAANSEYRRVVQPALDKLAAENGVTALGLELDSRERIVLVAIARPDGPVSLHVSIGSRLPAYLGALGRCFAARSGLDRERLKKKFETLRWDKAPRFEDWYASVEATRVEGVAFDRGNYVRGLTMVGALLPEDAHGGTRGIAVVGFDHQMTDKAIRRLSDELQQGVQTVAAQLK